jgi:hypothetical protein
MPDLAQLQRTLDSMDEPYTVQPIGVDMLMLVTQRGARVLGGFPNAGADNLFWTNSALTEASSFAAFINCGDWNLGGERIWIAPEIQYNVRDREDFWGTLSVPGRMDPGDYLLSTDQNRVYLRATMGLTAHVLASGTKTLYVRRTIQPVANPLRTLAVCGDMMRDVAFGGYEHSVHLTDTNDTEIVSEAWNLVQLRAGGTLLIACSPMVEASDYFGMPVPELRKPFGGALRIPITGRQQYKVGYKAPCMTGRMAYLNMLEGDSYYLLVRHFHNQLNNLYAEEPPHQPGSNGHSVHVYNDGGEFGGADGFGEMECTGTTIGGQTGRREALDAFSMYIYVGTKPRLARIAEFLLGVAL